ncbi:MAG: hypothetical protein JOZ26_14010 [Hyphomicrobiales bacterium]|nr:hypothetical protein [Hyphomicrobiales bacterium]
MSAEIHRRLHDPTLFDSGLEPILRKVVATVIDQEAVIVNWKIETIDLSFDQMSVLGMLVLEIANNSAKHLFQRGLRSHFEVELVRISQRGSVHRGPGSEKIEL